MRVAPDEYLRLRLRAHELLRDVPLYDVSVIDLPGGGNGRTIADIRALDSAAPPSRIATFSLRGATFSGTRVPLGFKNARRRLDGVAFV